jgi:hypothetical protein
MPRNSFDSEQMKMGEFVGYTKNEFENINLTLNRIEENLKTACEMSEQNKTEIKEMKAQAGLFGSIAGAIASVIVAIIFLILGK